MVRDCAACFNYQLSFRYRLLEQTHQEIISYPSSTVSWSSSKDFGVQQNSTALSIVTSYTFKSIREVLPVALDSVSTTSIHRYYYHSIRIPKANSSGLSYGMKELLKRVIKTIRKID